MSSVARATRLVSLTAAMTFVWAGVGGAPASGAVKYPLTIRNCGTTTVFKKAPSRAVSLSGTTTEVMLHLGLQKRMVGTAYQTDPIFAGGGGFASLARAYRSVPVLAAKYPSREVVLNARPDFVVGTSDDYVFGPTKNGGTGFTRAEFAKRKIGTYTFQCHNEKQSIGLTLRRYEEFGKIFGRDEKAKALTRKIRRVLAATSTALRDQPRVKTFFYQAGRGPLTTFGGGGGFDAGLELAGGANIFKSLPSFPTPTVSAEEVIVRNPAAILIVDQGSGDKVRPADKKKFLVSTLGKSVKAVKDNHFCYMSFSGLSTGVRTAVTLRSLVPCLHPKIKLR